MESKLVFWNILISPITGNLGKESHSIVNKALVEEY